MVTFWRAALSFPGGCYFALPLGYFPLVGKCSNDRNAVTLNRLCLFTHVPVCRLGILLLFRRRNGRLFCLLATFCTGTIFTGFFVAWAEHS